MITQELLKQLFDYRPDTGEFRRSISRRGVAMSGTLAGSKTRHGYLSIRINKKHYFSHRLAWLYVYGKWPSGGLDHIDGDKTNNRIANLREATESQNQANRFKGWGVSGLKGVNFHKSAKKWMSRITKGRSMIYLGLFDTPEEAYKAYCAAAINLFGEFAPLNIKDQDEQK